MAVTYRVGSISIAPVAGVVTLWTQFAKLQLVKKSQKSQVLRLTITLVRAFGVDAKGIRWTFVVIIGSTLIDVQTPVVVLPGIARLADMTPARAR